MAGHHGSELPPLLVLLLRRFLWCCSLSCTAPNSMRLLYVGAVRALLCHSGTAAASVAGRILFIESRHRCCLVVVVEVEEVVLLLLRRLGNAALVLAVLPTTAATPAQAQHQC